MELRDPPDQQQRTATHRWSWPAAVLFISASSAVGWILLVTMVRLLIG